MGAEVLTLRTAPELADTVTAERAFAPALATAPGTAVVLDLSAVTFLAMEAVVPLLALVERCAAEGRALLILASSSAASTVVVASKSAMSARLRIGVVVRVARGCPLLAADLLLLFRRVVVRLPAGFVRRCGHHLALFFADFALPLIVPAAFIVGEKVPYSAGSGLGAVPGPPSGFGSVTYSIAEPL